MARYALALFLGALILAEAGAARAAEVIRSFDSAVRVARDGTLTVAESIRVRAEGAEIKRGIYREFPLTFQDAGGRVHEVTFKLVSVTRDGRPEPHFTRRVGESIRIYAGQQDVMLRRGEHTYVFTYETGRQIRWHDGKAELYWNVTGNAWNFPIENASVRVELPARVRPVRWTAYTGPYGARGTDWDGYVASNGTLSIETTRRLARAEGFTIVAEIPAGAVEPPSANQQLWYAFLDNRNWVVGMIGFILVLGYYGWAWTAVGRDPPGGTIIPLFYPPKGVSPALANYVHNWGLSRERWRAFTAAALALAVRGLLLFDDADGKLTLKATGKKPQGGAAALPPGERAIYSWVEGRGGTAVIDKANGTAVAKVGDDFKSNIEKENKGRFFRRNLGYFFGGIALTVVVAIGIFLFGNLSDVDIGVLAFMAFAGVFLGVFIVPLLAAVFGGASHSLVRSAFTLIVVVAIGVSLLGPLISSASSNISSFLPSILSGLAAHPFPFALVMGFAALNGVFLYLLRAPTALGRPIMDQLAGFRMYLETAETPRLNMEVPEVTAERFEAILPYAVALDAEKPWSDAFAAALRRAHPEDPDPMHYYRPTWRTGSSWSSSDFSRTVASTVTAATTALAASIPRASSSSSGFSGGGGSGGGGGGGGGGGW